MDNGSLQRALRAPLTLPFALVGMCGGHLVGDRLGADAREGPMGLLLTLVTALVAGRLGWLLSRTEPEPPVIDPWWLRVSVRSIMAGGLNGVALLAVMCVCIVFEPGRHSASALAFVVPAAAGAWIFGALVSLAFIPSLVLVAGLWERARAARAGSQAHAVLTSATWLAAVLLALIHGFLSLHTATIHYDDDGRLVRSIPRLGPLLFVVGAAAVALLANTLRGALALRGSLRLLSSLERRGLDHAGMAVVADTRAADLGVGDEEWVEVREGDDPYRDPTRALVRVVGNRAQSKRLVQDGALWLVVGLPVVSLLSLGWLNSFR